MGQPTTAAGAAGGLAMRYIFDNCVLDTTLYVLHRGGQPVRLRPKAFQMLVYLLTQRERVVTRQELREQVWPGRFISDATLESTVAAVRRALGDSRQGQRYLHTLWGYGYRFMAPVEEQAADTALTSSETPPLPSEFVSDAGERKLVTVLCCALHPTPGPWAQGNLDTLHQQLHILYDLVEHEAQPYGGTVHPVVGEQVLVVFGAPAAQEDHAQRAVLVALSLQQRLEQETPAPGEEPTTWPPIRVGVHTGLVAVGGLRHAAATSMGVVGETVTQAVALQAAAPPGILLCSAVTARLVRGVVRLAVTALPALPGLPTPVYQLLGLHRALSGRRGRRPRSPFVGRQQELATLQAALVQAEAGQGQVVGIVGEPGLGKSRLLYEFRHWLRQRRRPSLAVSCLSYAQATPYGPVRELLRRSCRITAADPPATIRAKIHRELTAVGIGPEEAAPYLLHLLEVPTEMDLTATHSPQAIRARTMAGLVQLALAGARQRPLVLVVENLQWLDPSSEEVLTALVERLAGAALLLLLSYRPGYRLPWVDRSYVTQVALSRLSPADSRQVVRATLGPAPVTEVLVQAMVERAAGNPFFLEELARAVGEHDATRGAPVVPETVQGVLAARIDRLPPVAKHVLQVAAVIGKDVPIPLLYAVAGVSEDALEQGLLGLQAAEFLEESDVGPARVYAFRHILVQEVAYQSLLADARQQLHQRTAEVLAARFAATVEAQPELVAQHYTEAGHTEQAIAYWQRAGLRALQHSANREAIRHLTRGLVLLATLPKLPARAQQELDLLIALGPALMATRGQAAPEVEQTYARARALCAQVGETPQLFPTLRGLCRFYQSRGPLPTARKLGEQLYWLAQRTTAPTPRLEAHDALGSTLFLLGEYPAAQKHLEQGIALIDPAAQQALMLCHGVTPGVRCLALAALTLWCLGYPTQAVQRIQEALALAQTLDHFQSLAYAQHTMTTLYHRRRETPALQAQADTLLTRATAQEFPLWVGHGTFWQGWVLAILGQGEVGLAQMHQGLMAVLATGQKLSQPYQLVLLAETARHVGQIAEGLCWLAEALTAFEATGRDDMLAEVYRLQGEFLLRQATPDAAQAETCFEQALTIARRQQAKSWELRAAMSLARLWQPQGKYAEAYELLAPVYGWFTEGFDTADLQEAKALLDELW